MTQDIKLPPPPDSVEIADPDGNMIRVNTYGSDGVNNRVQRVTWDFDNGVWLVDTTVAGWKPTSQDDGSTNKNRWTLRTKRHDSLGGGPTNADRIEILGRRIEMLQADAAAAVERHVDAERRLLSLEQWVSSYIEWITESSSEEIPSFTMPYQDDEVGR